MIFYVTHVHPLMASHAQSFPKLVDSVLHNSKGWKRFGYTFKRVTSGTSPSGTSAPGTALEVFKIILSPPSYMETKLPLHFVHEQLSVADRNSNTIYVNSDRWTGAIPNKSGLRLKGYQTYIINHEVGHLLGKDHPGLKKQNQWRLKGYSKAPIMIQQTLGIGAFRRNKWPQEYDNDQHM